MWVVSKYFGQAFFLEYQHADMASFSSDEGQRIKKELLALVSLAVYFF